MKKCLLIPAIIFPYTVFLCLVSMFSNTIIKVFVIIPIITFILSFICNLIFIFTTRNASAKELIQSSLLIKALHIPTYIVFFLWGLIMGLMFHMTFPFIIFLMIIDLLTLWISSMVSIYSIIKAIKEKNTYSTAFLVVTLFCQFFWCADIAGLFIVFIVTKMKKNQAPVV